MIPEKSYSQHEPGPEKISTIIKRFKNPLVKIAFAINKDHPHHEEKKENGNPDDHACCEPAGSQPDLSFFPAGIPMIVFHLKSRSCNLFIFSMQTIQYYFPYPSNQ